MGLRLYTMNHERRALRNAVAIVVAVANAKASSLEGLAVLTELQFSFAASIQ